ncbi:nucleotide-diphospho-sugar transferase [Tanacetum coccineum]
MIDLRADVELKDNILVAMHRIKGEGHYTCNVRVEYEWKPPRCSSCKVFGHIHEECLKNIGAGEKKTLKKPSQTSRGVSVSPKIGFKPQKEYRAVPKKANASSSGNKKKGVEPTIEVSNSNPFDVLNSIDNDVEFGTNGGTTNLVNNEATSSGSSFMNINNDGEFASNTPIVSTGIVESDSEVEVVFDETANLRISTSGKDGSDKGYGTNSLLEQWRDSYPDNDDYDPYDDDMYENHDLSEHLQSICDDLDITDTKLNVIFMDTAYGRRWIRRIGNCEYVFSCEDLALIRHFSFPGYDVLVKSLGGKTYILSIVDDYSRRNGVAERMNITLMDKRLRKKTLMEMWSGHPSDYGMLRIFSCATYPQDKQGDQETDQQSDLTYYQLVRDRELRTRTKPLRLQDESNMDAYAFVAPKEEDTHEQLTYQEAVACEDSSN